MTQILPDQLRFEFHGVNIHGNEDDTPEAVRVLTLGRGAVIADATIIYCGFSCGMLVPVLSFAAGYGRG